MAIFEFAEAPTYRLDPTRTGPEIWNWEATGQQAALEGSSIEGPDSPFRPSVLHPSAAKALYYTLLLGTLPELRDPGNYHPSEYIAERELIM
jgi:hypothetical protein